MLDFSLAVWYNAVVTKSLTCNAKEELQRRAAERTIAASLKYYPPPH